MGSTRDDFHKYPRTPHLFGSTGTSDDKHLGARESEQFLADASLIVEEKLDGTNVGIHFTTANRMVLQCRGHEITAGMHPQYDLFKQWVTVKRDLFERMLADRFLLFGEWLYAKHSVYYRTLPHYFFEFDILDKETGRFLDLARRLQKLEGSELQTVPIVHRGALSLDELRTLMAPSAFEAEFENPGNGQRDSLVEGLYLRTEADGEVTLGHAQCSPAPRMQAGTPREMSGRTQKWCALSFSDSTSGMRCLAISRSCCSSQLSFMTPASQTRPSWIRKRAELTHRTMHRRE